MQPLNVSLVQTPLHWQNPPANRKALAGRLTELEGQTDLVVLPEMFATGFTLTPEDHAEPAGGPTLEWMQDQAARLGATVTGSLAVRDGGQHFNPPVLGYARR